MMRRLLVVLLMIGLALVSVGSYWQSRVRNEALLSEWPDAADVNDAGGVTDMSVVSTPLLSVRRAPDWLISSVVESELLEAVSAVMEMPNIPDQTCLVVHRDGQPVIEVSPDEPLIPASLMKIVTASVLLDAVSPTFRYTTEVVVDTDALESAKDGVMEGDIYLIGGGDPVLATPDYMERRPYPESDVVEQRVYTDVTELAERTAEALRQRGISRIVGSVIADESHYPEEERDYTKVKTPNTEDAIWKTSYIRENQVGQLSALLLNDGYASYDPIDASPVGRRRNVRSDDPALQAAADFDDLLEERDFVIRRRPGKGVSPEEGSRTSLGSVQSPAVSEIVSRMLRYSDNTIAEMLFKEFGLSSLKSSARDQALFAVESAISRLLSPFRVPGDGVKFQVPTDGIVRVMDGSGLSAHNRVTCHMIVGLLRVALDDPESALIQGLVQPGNQGTLYDCEVDVPVKASTDATVEEQQEQEEPQQESQQSAPLHLHPLDRLKVKTGTLADSTSLAGVFESGSGKLTFAMIMNADNIIASLSSCNAVHKALMSAIIGHPYFGNPFGQDTALLPEPVQQLERG